MENQHNNISGFRKSRASGPKESWTEKVKYLFRIVALLCLATTFAWWTFEFIICWANDYFGRFEGFEQGLNTFHVGPSKGALNQRLVLLKFKWSILRSERSNALIKYGRVFNEGGRSQHGRFGSGRCIVKLGGKRGESFCMETARKRHSKITITSAEWF